MCGKKFILTENSEILIFAISSILKDGLADDIKLALIKDEVSLGKHRKTMVTDNHAYFVTYTHSILLL